MYSIFDYYDHGNGNYDVVTRTDIERWQEQSLEEKIRSVNERRTLFSCVDFERGFPPENGLDLNDLI